MQPKEKVIVMRKTGVIKTFGRVSLLAVALAGLILAACAAPEPELGPGPILCEPGQGASADGETCETCPAGTFSDDGIGRCRECPMDSFQGESGSTECITCPENTSTGGMTGAYGIVFCEPIAGGGTGQLEENDITPPEPVQSETTTPTLTPTPDLNGTWIHYTGAGFLDCGEFNKRVDPVTGRIEVIMSEDGSFMTMLGLEDYPELEIPRKEEGLYEVVLPRVEEGISGTITITVKVISGNMMEGMIVTVFGPCRFERPIRLEKAT
jgi:hypothetical protein